MSGAAAPTEGPPIRRRSLGWFVGGNAAWGGGIGVLVTITSRIVMQDGWFLQFSLLGGLLLSAGYGAVASLPAWLVGRRTRRFRVAAVTLTFGLVALMLPSAVVIIVNVTNETPIHWVYPLTAVAYAVQATIVAAVLYALVLRDEQRSSLPHS